MMRPCIRMRIPTVALVAVLGGSVHIASGQADDAAPNKSVNAATYIDLLVAQVGNDDPRVRYSVREALRVMGTQAVSALQKAKATHQSEHVKAFISRSVAFIKSRVGRDRQREEARQQRERGERRQPGQRNRRDDRNQVDIDRIAMEATLNWEQIAKLQPIVKKVRKDMTDLMAEFRESGAMRDRDAWNDLREEMKAITTESEPALKEFLDAKQIKRVKRYLDQGTGGRGMRGMRGRGGRGGRGERGGGRRERP